MTPGFNKRKLTRDTNAIIGTQKKSVVPIISIFPLRNVASQSNLKTPSTGESSMINKNESIPLKKLDILDDKKEDKVKSSLSFLRQLGTSNKPLDSRKLDSSINNPKDKFTIPPFKPKIKVVEQNVITNKQPEPKTSNVPDDSVLLPEVPPFKGSKPAKQSEYKVEDIKIVSDERTISINIIKPTNEAPKPKNQHKNKKINSKLMIHKTM